MLTARRLKIEEEKRQERTEAITTSEQVFLEASSRQSQLQVNGNIVKSLSELDGG